MSTREVPTPGEGNDFAGDVWVNFKRWNRKALRTPAASVLELSMALLSLVLFDAVFGGAGTLALREGGFADVGYLSFLLPAVVVQAAMAAAVTSGMGLVDDLGSGMFETVLVTPMSRTGVFVGKAAAELLRVALYELVVVGLALAMGATVETGPLGVAGILVVALLFAGWYMALSNVIALTARDAETLDAAGTLLLFPLLFLSSAFLPLSSLPGWIELVATVNPATYGVDAVRALVLGRDVMTVVEVTAFEGIWNTLVPALAVLVGLNLVVGGVAVWLLARASSAEIA